MAPVQSEFELNSADIILGERIAMGGFAEVFVGSYEGTLVAVKRLLDQGIGETGSEQCALRL